MRGLGPRPWGRGFSYELWSQLLKADYIEAYILEYIGDFLGDYYRGY